MKSYTNKGIRLAALLTSTLALGGLFLVAPAAHADYGVAPSPVINQACGGNRYATDCLEKAWNYVEENQVQQPVYNYYPTRNTYPSYPSQVYNYNTPSYQAPTYSYTQPAPVYNYNSYVAPEPEYSYPTTAYYYTTPSYNTSSYQYEYADNYSYNYSDGSDSYDYCNGSYDCSY